ncbi:MAG TPA: glycosyltransferase [Pyrinomonadaceae bacterium]|jgi:glycosyltransferase involved in cell wall biosynthesis|nr:glycosyltransferase [Pyrinomonadaceae bacterium]
MKKLRVHIVYEYGVDLRPHGCAHIRLMLPLNHPVNGDSLIVTSGPEYAKADVVVVDRTWSPGVSPAAAKALVKQIRADGAAFVYSIDDNLLDLKPEGFNRWPFTTEELMAVRCFAREADAIIVTTELLKERLTRLNKNIFVVPNVLDERLWSSESNFETPANDDNKRKVIGYMGTHTHDSDLGMILQALRGTLRKHEGAVELQLIGCVADQAVLDAFAGLQVTVLDVGDNVEYPAFARWMAKNVRWDLAIAPLENDVFTRCKSDIKFLDYSAVGIAGIYSQGPVYGKTVHHLETGYLADNNPESWSEGLELLLTDDSLRQSIAKKAQEYTFSSRTLQHRATDWRDVMLSVSNQ